MLKKLFLELFYSLVVEQIDTNQSYITISFQGSDFKFTVEKSGFVIPHRRGSYADIK